MGITAVAGKAKVEWLPMAIAARQLGLGWSAMYTRILRGDVEAKKDANGRWLISAPSVDRLAKGAP
jgi:hypothetical protein